MCCFRTKKYQQKIYQKRHFRCDFWIYVWEFTTLECYSPIYRYSLEIFKLKFV